MSLSPYANPKFGADAGAPLAAAGAAFPWAGLAMALAPMLLGPALGAMDPARRRAQLMERMASPEHLMALQQLFRSRIFNSSGYAAANRGLGAGAAASEAAMRTGLARSGMSGTGIGAIAPGLAHLSFGINRGRLIDAAEGRADNMGLEAQRMQLAGMSGSPIPTNYMANLLAGGINAFGPLAGAWARKKYDLPQEAPYA